MIRDLEAEVVAIRNLLEVVAVKMLSDEAVAREYEKYFKHRCERFDQEVEEANKVLKKNMKLHGYDYSEGYTFVPGEWAYEQKRFTDKLKLVLDEMGYAWQDIVEKVKNFKYSWEKSNENTDT